MNNSCRPVANNDQNRALLYMLYFTPKTMYGKAQKPSEGCPLLTKSTADG